MVRDESQVGVSDFIFLTTKGDDVHTFVSSFALICLLVLLGSMQKTPSAEPTSFSAHCLLRAPTLILKY